MGYLGKVTRKELDDAPEEFTCGLHGGPVWSLRKVSISASGSGWAWNLCGQRSWSPANRLLGHQSIGGPCGHRLPQPGHDLVLTIDSEVQEILVSALAAINPGQPSYSILEMVPLGEWSQSRTSIQINGRDA